MTKRRLIFCLTTGRSGTAYLATVLNRVPHSYAVHEPFPNFVNVLHEPDEVKLKWVQEEKLVYIDSRLDEHITNYIETSHMFSDFTKLFHYLEIEFDCIRLHRALHSVALSAWRKGYIPARTMNMRRYFENPRFSVVGLTDYQLCYWYALEKDRRADLAQKYVTGTVYDTELSKVVNEPSFMLLLEQMNLEKPAREIYDNEKTERVNYSETMTMPEGDLLEQEIEMRQIWSKYYEEETDIGG